MLTPNSSYWTKFLVSPLPLYPDILHAYLALRLGDEFYRVELKFPSALRERKFVEQVSNMKYATEGQERFIFSFSPFFPISVGRPKLITLLEDLELTRSILDYARNELPFLIPEGTQYCSARTPNSFNSNSVIHLICSQYPQLGQLPSEAVGKKPNLEQRILPIAAE